MFNFHSYALLAMLFFSAAALTAQETHMGIKFDSKLESVLILNIDPEARVEFEVEEVNENLYQITQPPDDINFSVEATGNWNLSISAANPYFVGTNDTTKKIPVDFLGFTIQSIGTNWDNGLFSNMANLSKDTVLPLTHDKITVLTNGRQGNAGGSDQNSFVLRWHFVFEQEPGKIHQFSQMNLKNEYYTGNFYLILTESMEPRKSK